MAISYGTYTITEVQEGSQIWTSSAAPTTPNYTFDVSKLVGDSETSIKSGDIIMHSYNRYTVLSVSSDGKTVLAGNLQSIRGATGAASVTYALIVSNLAIVKDKDGNLSPSTITVTAKSQTGSNAMANYTGRIKIETTTNNSTWTSRINEDAATKTYTIPSDTVAIRCSLYLKGGTTTLLDQQTVPIVSDGTDGINGTNGKDGANGKDAYTVILTNENHTFAGNTTSAIASEIECNIIAYKGITQIVATIGTITGQPTGMTTEILNNGKTNASFKVNVTTSMVTKNGVLNIPITVDGKAFTKKFTYTLTLDGEKGDKGDRGTNGASQNLLLDAYAPSLARVDAPSSRYLSDASNSTITGEFIAEDNLPDPNATHFYRITDSSATTKGRGLCFYGSSTPPFIAGHTYRIGCWVRKHAGSPKMNITLGSHGSWMPTQRIIDNTDWEWIEVVRTFGDTTSADKTPIPDTYKRLYFYFYNNNVAGSSLDMCGFRMEELQTNSGTARNLLLGTEKLTNWGVTNGATISDGVVTFPTITSNSWREIYPAKNFKYELIRNQYVIFSIKVKGNIGEKCCINLGIGVDTTETAYIRKKFLNQYVYFVGTGEWQTVCSALPIFDYMFTSGSETVDFDDCWVTVRIGAVNNYWNGFQAKEPQLCLGTTATSWSRAPEDIDEAIDNINIGGRNLLKESDCLAPVQTSKGITITYNGNGWFNVNGTVTGTSAGVLCFYGNTSHTSNITSSGEYTLSIETDGTIFLPSNKTWIQLAYHSDNATSDTIAGNFKILSGSTKVTFTISENHHISRVCLFIQANATDSVVDGNIRLKLERGNKATDWTPAPEDIEASAVTEEQYIYIQTTSGTNSVNPTTIWVTENGESTISDTQGLMPVWTTKRPTYRTNYPVIFIAKQKKTVDGTVTCTTPIKDDTLTIIDGGHITTGTIDASKVTVTNIDASKITTGTLKAERINTKSISIGDFKDGDDYAKTEDVNTAIDNIEVGGRNLVWNSNFHLPINGTWSNWGSPTTREIVTINGENWMHIVTTANSYQGYSQTQANRNGFGEIQAGEQIVFSFDAYSKVDGQEGCIGIHWRNSNNTTVNQNWASFNLTTTKKRYVTNAFTVPDNAVGFNIMVGQRIATAQELWITNIKGEKGNKATDWTPAPEDVVNEAFNKVEVGGRNLIRNSTNFNKWHVQNGGAEGEIWHKSLSGKTSNANARPRTWVGTGYLADYYNKTLTISFEIMSPDWSAINEGSSYTGLNALAIQLETTNGTPYSVMDETGRYFFSRLGNSNFKLDSELVNGQWVKVTSVPLKIDDSFWTNDITKVDGYDNFTFSFLLRRNGEISFKKPQIELGNKATDFTLAPEDIEVDIEDARKVATNYLAVDNTGIMVADMQDGEQTPSTATGRNVFIDNDSVDIRDGQNTLASFTGNNTKFYDIEQNREVASFGTNGVRVGSEDEQHFIVDSESIQAINENGSSIFSVQSTGGTITTEVVVAKGGNSQPHTDWEVYLNGGSSVPQNTFYAKEYSLLIDIDNSINTFDSMKVSINDGNFQNVPVVRKYYQNTTGMTVYSGHLVTLPPFSFQYGTKKVYSYHVEGVYVSDKGNTYRYSSTIHMSYDGQRTITMEDVGGTLTQTSGSASGDNTSIPYGGNSTIWGDIYSSLGYAKAPAMTFGTRGRAGTVAPLSVTIGEELYANNDNQLSIGKYNLNNDEFSPLAFAIGNGVNDTDRSNAFNVDWDGNVENMGNLEVGESLMVNGNLYAKGRLLYDSTSTPLFKIVTRTIDNISIDANNSAYPSVAVNESGYTPIAISGVTLGSASNGGTTYGYSIVQSFGINGQTLNFYVGNWNTSSAAKIKLVIKVLCIRTSAL